MSPQEEERGAENGEGRGGGTWKNTGPDGRKRAGTYDGVSQRRQDDCGTETVAYGRNCIKPTKEKRNMRSWERAKPLSRPDVSLVIGGGWKFIVPDMFPCALGRRIGIKYPRLISLFLTLYYAS